MARIESHEKDDKGRLFWFFYAIKLVPVLFIVTIIGWSYYAYVVELCSTTITSTAKRVVYLLPYHGFLFVFLWSYWQTIFTLPGKVPEKFKLTEGEYDRLMHADNEQMQQAMLADFSKDLPILNYTLSGGVRYCDKCRIVKPDRSHHCSVCGRCVLKMDHHCPWVNNCISFTNYKFFMLFLAFGLIYCLFVTFTTLEYFISFWSGNIPGTARFHILFLFFVALMFAVSLLSLFSYHGHLIRSNRTTLEAFRPAVFQTGPDSNGYNLGTCANFREVFGNRHRTWLLPIRTSLGDGCTFPTRRLKEEGEQLLSRIASGEEEEEFHYWPGQSTNTGGI